MSDERPATCRFRLQDEGKAYPKSGCMGCGRNIETGLDTSCHKVAPTPSPQDDPIERLRNIWERDEFVEGPMPLFIASFVSGELTSSYARIDELEADRDEPKIDRNGIAIFKVRAKARNDALEEAKAACSEYKKSHDVVMEQHGNSDYHARCSAAVGRCLDIIEGLKTPTKKED